ncbi:MAG TPA: hypothetical protein PLY85_11995, partial [Anaerolineaceae bacterium]|nr:hypothetical protein [Anaerolineaceae bacterium]
GLMLAEHSRPQIPMDRVIGWELEILGSHGMQAYRYEDMFAMITAGKLHPEKLVTKHINLSEAPAALAGLHDFKGTGITVIDRFQG